MCNTKQYAPKMPCICQLVHVQLSENYVSTYASNELSVINNVTTNTGILI